VGEIDCDVEYLNEMKNIKAENHFIRHIFFSVCLSNQIFHISMSNRTN
jgi:hypothetical protein